MCSCQMKAFIWGLFRTSLKYFFVVIFITCFRLDTCCTYDCICIGTSGKKHASGPVPIVTTQGLSVTSQFCDIDKYENCAKNNHKILKIGLYVLICLFIYILREKWPVCPCWCPRPSVKCLSYEIVEYYSITELILVQNKSMLLDEIIDYGSIFELISEQNFNLMRNLEK